MKLDEQLKARELRQLGRSIKEIAKEIKVAPSSVSLWVRDIQLTEQQKEILSKRNPAINAQNKGAQAIKQKCLLARQTWQLVGQEMAKNNKNRLFIAGCMLYWAEGSKSRTQVHLVNADLNLLKTFLKFLTNEMDVKNHQIRLQINCFTDLQSLAEIENYWITKLGLQKDNLHKSMVNIYSKYSQKKRKNKLPYGTCAIRVCSTELVQKIYGAIQHIGEFENLTWVS